MSSESSSLYLSSCSPFPDPHAPPTNSQTIPGSTSDWTVAHLNRLHIAIIKSKAFSPISIITDIFNYCDPLIEERASKIKEHICRNMPMGLSQLQFSSIEKVHPGLTSKDGSCWKIPPISEPSAEPLFEKFRVQGEKFARYLNYMAIMKQQGDFIITKMMYQNLFQYFVEMFGLYCYPSPAVKKHTMVINSEEPVEVESIADLLILKSDNFKSTEIIAVCEVEDYFDDEAELGAPSPPKSRCLENHPKKAICHLSEKLIGQSGGELLLHFQSSASKKGILGLIVQKTYVTFTRICMEKDDLDAISTGNPSSIDTGPSIRYSKPYNYLDIEHCKELIEPLLMLGFIQSRSDLCHL